MSQWKGSWWRNPEFTSCSRHAVNFHLSKNLAGSPRKISGDEFIEWAKAGEVPDDEARHHLREALCDLEGSDIWLILCDDRTHPENIMRLIVDCEADRDGECWNNMLRSLFPHLPVHPRKPEWDMNDKIAGHDWTGDGDWGT